MSFCCTFSKSPHSEEYITLSLPTPALNLGTPPRLCYPLVIFLLRCDPDTEIHPDETVSDDNRLLNLYLT